MIFFEIAKFRRQIGKHEGVGIIRAKIISAGQREISLVLTFVDDVIELFFQTIHFVFVEVAVHLRLGLVEQFAPAGSFHQTKQLLVLRMTHFNLQHAPRTILLFFGGRVRFFEQLFRLVDEAIAKAQLFIDQTVDNRLKTSERLLALDRRRT